MSLEGQHLGAPDETLSTKTYSRTNSTEDFTGISIFYDVWNYYYGSHAFDVALQLQDGSGNVVQTFDSHKTSTMKWNDNYSATPVVSIPSTVADGTYYVKAMSRLHGGTNWQECYDGNAYKMTATISGNELTMTVPIPGNVLCAMAANRLSLPPLLVVAPASTMAMSSCASMALLSWERLSTLLLVRASICNSRSSPARRDATR